MSDVVFCYAYGKWQIKSKKQNLISLYDMNCKLNSIWSMVTDESLGQRTDLKAINFYQIWKRTCFCVIF